mgnify:CR=1 FL=1
MGFARERALTTVDDPRVIAVDGIDDEEENVGGNERLSSRMSFGDEQHEEDEDQELRKD